MFRLAYLYMNATLWFQVLASQLSASDLLQKTSSHVKSLIR